MSAATPSSTPQGSSHHALPNPARVDHLVVLAASLAEGVDWCEAVLGVAPQPGGAHPLMGTHNRLLRVGTPAFPKSYLEIVAIDPAAIPERAPPLRRWFDMDDEALRARLATSGPHLAHWVVRVPDVQAAVEGLSAQDIDRGRVIEASRMTTAGRLQWRLTVRDDGQRLFGGALPTLIEWGPAGPGSHPGESLPDEGIELMAMRLWHPRSRELQLACSAIGVSGVMVDAGPAGLAATLQTPRGLVTLASTDA